jgi:hypothetical protein
VGSAEATACKPRPRQPATRAVACTAARRYAYFPWETGRIGSLSIGDSAYSVNSFSVMLENYSPVAFCPRSVQEYVRECEGMMALIGDVVREASVDF